MDQIKYKGYAQRTQFDPIKAPDQTSRILAEAQRNIRGMQAARSQMNENNQAYLSGLQRKHALEKQNRESNYNLEKSFRARYQEQLRRNHEAKLSNIDAKLDSQLNTISALSSFSQTLNNTLGNYMVAKGEADELAGMNAVFEYGISLEEYNQIKSMEAQIDAFDTANNGLLASLQERGVGAEQLNAIRNLSGRRQVGAMKAFAIQGADNYPMFRAEHQDVMFDVDGEEYSLNTARNAGPSVWAAVNAQIRNEYLKQYRGLDPKFLNEYLFKGMRDTEQQERLSFANDRAKALSIEFTEQQTNELVTDWKAGGPQGIIDWIQRTSGGTGIGLRNQRRAAIDILTQLAKAGEFTANDLENLKAQGVRLKGATKDKAFGELFGRELTGLQSAIDDYSRTEYNRSQFNEQQQKEEDLRNLHNFVTKNGPLSEKERSEYEEYWRQKYGEFPPAEVSKFTSVEQLADAQAKAILESKARRGELTMDELMSGRYSTALINQYRSFAESHKEENKGLIDNLRKGIGAELKRSLTEYAGQDFNKISGDYYGMLDTAYEDLESRANTLIRQGSTVQDAWNQAYQEVIKDIEKGRAATPSGRYAMKTVGGQIALGAEAGFAHLDRDIAKETIANKERIAALGRDIATKGFEGVLNSSEQAQLRAAVPSGRLPGWVYQISEKVPNMSPYDLVDELLKGMGEQPLQQRPMSAAPYDVVRPEFMQLLTVKPSLARTTRALSQGDAYKPILDLIATHESSNDTANGGYDAMNTGGANQGRTAYGTNVGTAVFGRPLTEMTVGEVMSLQAQGRLHASGRYQITAGTLKGLVQAGKADPNDLYDQATQDKLAIALLNRRAGKFFSGSAGVDSVLYGMGSEWVGLQGREAKVREALLIAKQNLTNPAFDPERMKPGSVVYSVGGIGPRGANQYGPHLDIKRTDLKFFERTSLDTFIGFQTPNGILPVSGGATVAGGEFGAQRDYGSHAGWDYAMPQGTKVVLKNGARVIAKRPTDYGDQLTIEIPGGIRFNIIHGNAV